MPDIQLQTQGDSNANVFIIFLKVRSIVFNVVIGVFALYLFIIIYMKLLAWYVIEWPKVMGFLCLQLQLTNYSHEDNKAFFTQICILMINVKTGGSHFVKHT